MSPALAHRVNKAFHTRIIANNEILDVLDRVLVACGNDVYWELLTDVTRVGRDEDPQPGERILSNEEGEQFAALLEGDIEHLTQILARALAALEAS